MINEKITDFISSRLNISRKDLVEKDILLTKILYYLSSDKNFYENYAFKGGTCLIKCYLGYYRFSEDLDFTYLNSNEFKGKSEKKIRALISKKIDELSSTIEKIAKTLDLRFKFEKENKEYFEFGGSNSFVTFKLWYYSKELKKDSFIKIQINHREDLHHKTKELRAISIIPKKLEKDFEFLYREESDIILKPLKIKAYDLNDILIEKIRAILTRRGVKARDFIDVYKIVKSENIRVESLRDKIVSRTKDMLKFDKYKSNLENKQEIDFSKEIDLEKIKLTEERILLDNISKRF